MDPSQRRCFLEVYTDEDEEPRLLQLEPNVKFHNVLERFDEMGDLYWRERPLDPELTPAAVGMPCGVDQANTLWFVPASASSASHERPSSVWAHQQRTPLVESTAAMRSSPENERSPTAGRASSLPAYFDDATASTVRSPPQPPRAAGATTAGPAALPPPMSVSWYSRPRLLSPAQPPAATVMPPQRAIESQQQSPPSSNIKAAASVFSPYAGASPIPKAAPRGVSEVAAVRTSSLSATQLQYQQQQPPRPPPPAPAAPVHAPRAAGVAPDVTPAAAPASSPTQPRPQRGADSRRYTVPSAARAPAVDTRRNRPILIDPAVLIDDAAAAGPVELLQSELRRLQRDVEVLKHVHGSEAQPQPSRGARGHERRVQRSEQLEVFDAQDARAAASPSPIPASSTDPSVEELAMELHDKQMHRLYEQRRFYLTHGQVARS